MEAALIDWLGHYDEHAGAWGVHKGVNGSWKVESI
jgi:hypothetical protein